MLMYYRVIFQWYARDGMSSTQKFYLFVPKLALLNNNTPVAFSFVIKLMLNKITVETIFKSPLKKKTCNTLYN